MNQLQYIDEFKKVLATYHPSAEAKQLLAQTRLALLVGPSSSGRNSIINELLKTGDYHFIVSDTTRQPRTNNGVLEQDGREYWFRREEDLLDDLKNGRFLEAAVIHEQQVSGISMRELAIAAQDNKVAINEVEVLGADGIHELKPDGCFIFLLPPSFDEWMVRMNARGALPADEITRRVTSAIAEITAALQKEYYHLAVNDTFMQTARYLNQIIMEGLKDAEREAHARTVAQQLLEDTQAYLATAGS